MAKTETKAATGVFNNNKVTINEDLNRFFKSVEEENGPLEATIKGEIPKWVNGTLIRVGPGKFDFGDFTVNHWLDGYAILYSFAIKNGKVIYRCRFLNSDAYQRALAVQRPVYTEFGTKAYSDPGKNVITRLFNKLVPTDFTDNTVINIYQFGHELYCATESCHVRRIEVKSIDTLEKVDLYKLLGLNMACAHVQIAPDGTGYNIGSSFLSGLKYHLFKIPPLNPKSHVSSETCAFQNATMLANIPCRWKTYLSYCHSFGLSQNYAIIVEQPLLINTLKVATINAKGRSLRECIEWKPEEKTRFIVLNRHTGQLSKVTYMADGFFMLHHINAYEEDDHLVVDVLTYRTLDILDKWYLNCLRNNQFRTNDLPKSQRFVLPLESLAKGPVGVNLVKLNYTTATAETEPNGSLFLIPENLVEPGFELPQINKAFNCQKYKYAYGSGCFMQGTFQNSVCKANVQTKHTLVYKHCDYCYPGEPMFVPTPGGSEEDDGILLTVAVDIRPDATDYMIVLDAKTMKEVALVAIPVKAPALLHGTFVNEYELNQ